MTLNIENMRGRFVRGLPQNTGLALAIASAALLARADLALGADMSAKEDHEDHAVVLEIAPTMEWPFNGQHPNFGGSIAAEATAVENWLELDSASPRSARPAAPNCPPSCCSRSRSGCLPRSNS